MKKKLLLMAISTLLMSGCNEMQQSKPAAVKVAEKYTATAIVISGKAEAKSGEVTATDEAQNVIISTDVEANGRYQLEIPAQTKLPIVLHSNAFIAVVVDTDLTQYDINALTTSIAEKAKVLGGYSRKNMILAASNSVHTPDANKTTTGFRGDPTTQYGGWH